MADSNRPDSRTYNLSKFQLAHLLGEDTEHRRAGKLDEEIKDTATNLDQRIRYLIEDISLLYAHGYLDDETWPNAWDDLSHIDRIDGHYNPPAAIRGPPKDYIDSISLAIHFGHACRLLYSATAPEYDEDDIALGLLIGLTGGWLKEEWSADSSIQKLLDDMPDEDLQTELFEMPSLETIENLREVLSDIDESIKNANVASDPDNALRERLQESDLTLTPPLFKHAKHVFAEQGVPPVPSVIDKVVTEIESNQEVLNAERLAEYLQRDIVTLKETEWRGPSASQVFWAIYDLEADETKETAEKSSQLSAEIDEKQQLIEKLVNDMSGREPPWVKRPVVDKGQFLISATEYGKVIGHLLTQDDDTDKPYTLPSEDDVYRVCHAAVLGRAGETEQQMVESALNEIGLSS